MTVSAMLLVIAVILFILACIPAGPSGTLTNLGLAALAAGLLLD